jgi:hypothetical protein
MSHWIIELKRGSIEGNTLTEAKEKFLEHCIEEDFPFDITEIQEEDYGEVLQQFSQNDVKRISDQVEREYWEYKEANEIEIRGLREAQNELTPIYY